MATKKRKVDIRSRRTVYKGRYKVEEMVFDFDRTAGKGRLTDGEARSVRARRQRGRPDPRHRARRDRPRRTVPHRDARERPGYLVEAMAGSVEEGEDPEECIRREMMEEVGYRAGDLHPDRQWLCLAGLKLGADLSLLCAREDRRSRRSESVRTRR